MFCKRKKYLADFGGKKLLKQCYKENVCHLFVNPMTSHGHQKLYKMTSVIIF